MLKLALTGNLEDNFNKLVLFFDSKPGGQNVLDTDTENGGVNPVVDRSPFGGDPGMFAKLTNSPLGNSTFDAGFEADYALVLRHGFTGAANRFDVDFAVLGGDASQYLGVFDPTSSNSGSTGTLIGVNGVPIEVGFDNSNTLGIDGGSGAADQTAAAAVVTGIELSLSLADLGNPGIGDPIKVTALINNSNHDYLSNQLLAGLPSGQGNLGSDGAGGFVSGESYFNLSGIAGDQYFVVTAVPEASAVLFGGSSLLVVLVGGWVRRRLPRNA